MQRMAFNSCIVHALSIKSLLLQYLWKLTYMRMPSKILLQHWKISKLAVGVLPNCQAPCKLNGLLLILSSLLCSLCRLQFKATMAGSLQTAFASLPILQIESCSGWWPWAPQHSGVGRSAQSCPVLPQDSRWHPENKAASFVQGPQLLDTLMLSSSLLFFVDHNSCSFFKLLKFSDV